MNDYLAAIVDGYFTAADWIAKNPQKTLWLAFVSIVVLAVL